MNLYPPESIILAPLSGYTDLPYRRSARRFGCRYAFTEMIDAASIAFNNAKTCRLLERGEDEQWLGVQLVGSNPDWIKAAVETINQHEFDVLDFNLGCPVAKVAKKGAGAVLGKNIERAVELFSIIRANSRFPVSAKIRILDEKNPEPTVALVKGLADAGAVAVTIHGRIKDVFYSGPVFFNIISAARAAVDIQIIANGGITDLAKYQEIALRTGCDCAMLARGAMGNPWLFKELQEQDNYQPPSVAEFCGEIRQHVLEMVDYYGVELASRLARKIILDYLRGRGFPGTLKAEVSFLKTLDDFFRFLELIAAGPAERYWQWLEINPAVDRKLAQ
ncbi:MAG: tRNA-dihydrouridine synthase family protein [Victivallaceae bacterium]